MTTTDKPHAVIWAHMPVSCRNIAIYKGGLHRLVTPEARLLDLLWESYERYLGLAKKHGIDLRLFVNHPWGRWLPQIRVLDNYHLRWPLWPFRVTSMRMDSYRTCQERAPWLCRAVDELLRRHEGPTIFYTGANPAASLSSMQLDKYHPRVGLAMDALASQKSSMLVTDLLIKQRDGQEVNVWSEANRRHPLGLPCIAKYTLWDRLSPEYHTLHDAPPFSMAWWPGGCNTDEEWHQLQRLTGAGLQPVVSLSQTKDPEQVFRVVAESRR